MREVKERYYDETENKRLLDTKSVHNMYYQLREDGVKPVKRYVKTVLYGVSFERQEPFERKRVSGILKTTLPKDYMPGQHTVPFRYEDNVIELYSDEEVRIFDRLHQILLDNETLVEYADDAEYEYDVEGYLIERPTTKDIEVKKRLATVRSE